MGFSYTLPEWFHGGFAGIVVFLFIFLVLSWIVLPFIVLSIVSRLSKMAKIQKETHQILANIERHLANRIDV